MDNQNEEVVAETYVFKKGRVNGEEGYYAVHAISGKPHKKFGQDTVTGSGTSMKKVSGAAEAKKKFDEYMAARKTKAAQKAQTAGSVKENVQSMINAVSEKNAGTFQEIFGQELLNRVNAEIDARKSEVAKTLINVEDSDSEVVEEGNGPTIVPKGTISFKKQIYAALHKKRADFNKGLPKSNQNSISSVDKSK